METTMEMGEKILPPPIPHIPENTKLFPAGAVTFGLEHRQLNNEIIDAHLAAQTHLDTKRKTDIDVEGLSIHVFGADGREHLRFDCFEAVPHYHFIFPHSDYQRIAKFDAAQNGPPMAWTLGCLRDRLDPMLRAAGWDAVADACDPGLILPAVEQLEAAAEALATALP